MQFTRQLPYRLRSPSAIAGAVVLALVFTVHTLPLAAADLVGTARDQSGQPRGANVEVTLKAAESNAARRKTTTTAAGQFSFTGIAPGSYDLACGGQPIRIQVAAGINRGDCR